MKVLENDFNGGVNWHDTPWSEALKKEHQCLLLQNMSYKDRSVDSILGMQRHHGTVLGSDPVTAIMPYYNDQTDLFKLLVASGDKILVRDDQANEFTVLKSTLTPNSIYSHTIRYDVMYIASTKDGLKKYLGGNQIESVGTGLTAPGSFRFIVYMKEVDRMFGISDDAILGQISWCDIGDPETWDAASVERFKLQDGERTEGGAVLYGKLIIFNSYSIWIYFVQGNEENWKLEQAPTTVGCVAPGTIRKVGNEIWFLGKHPQHQYGVYAFNGSTCRLLTHDMEPLFETINKNKVRNSCAEVRGDAYRVTFPTDASEVNNVSLDLDIIHIKSDGTPAIYGPHTFSFCSSAVLNDRQNNNEWILGTDYGWVCKEVGDTVPDFVNGGEKALEQRFISRMENNGTPDVMKQLEEIAVFFEPRGFFVCDVNYYVGTSHFSNTLNFNPNAGWVGFAGDFNVYFNHLEGTPGLYEWMDYCGQKARGTTFQIEIVNRNIGKRLTFDAYQLQFTELYENKRVQKYVA